MEHQITVQYNRRIIRQALWCFFIHRLGRFTIAVLVIYVLLLALVEFSGSWNVYWTWLVAMVAVPLGLLFWLYFLRRRQSETFLSKMAEPSVRFCFSDDGVSTESDLGSSMLKWDVFDELLCFDDVWLLVYAKSAYVTLPVGALSDAGKSAIREKLTEKTEYDQKLT